MCVYRRNELLECVEPVLKGLEDCHVCPGDCYENSLLDESQGEEQADLAEIVDYLLL